MRKIVVLVALVFAQAVSAWSQTTNPVVRALPNGQVGVTGLPLGSPFTLEWSSSRTDPARTNWHTFTTKVVTGMVTAVEWPTYFRAIGFSDVTSTNLKDGLVAWYAFDGNALDLAGTNHGEVGGALLTGDRRGRTAGAYRLGGSTYLAATNGLPDMDSLSFSVWIRPQRIRTAADTVFMEGDGVAGADLLLKLMSNTCSFSAKSGPAITWSHTFTPTGQWAHVAGVCDAVNMTTEVWINGQRAADGDLYGSANVGYHNALQIGRFDDGFIAPQSYFAGDVDDLRFYNRALSTNEIVELYQQTPP